MVHFSHLWGCALGQPVRQASALVREGGMCLPAKKKKEINKEIKKEIKKERKNTDDKNKEIEKKRKNVPDVQVGELP